MYDNRDPTKHKCKTKVEDIVSVILAIAISVTALGLLGSIFKPDDSGSGFVKIEGSGSVTVGGLLDKEDDTTDNNGTDTDTDTGEGTDTENDDNADTDTTPGDDIVIEKSSKTYDFTSGLEGVSYSDNVDQNNLWVKTEALNGNNALCIGKSTTSSTAQKVWLDLSSVDSTQSKQVFEFYFLWSGSENGLSGLDYANTVEWYTTFSLIRANSSSLSISLCASEENKDFYSVSIDNAYVTTGYPINEWCNVRIEIENRIASIYINDSLVRGVSYPISTVDSFEIKHRGYVTDTNLYVDNVSFTTTN